jgi:hypothetical protein
VLQVQFDFLRVPYECLCVENNVKRNQSFVVSDLTIITNTSTLVRTLKLQSPQQIQ